MKLSTLRPAAAVLLTGLAAVSLVACGPTSTDGAPAGAATPGVGGSRGQFRMPGTSGLIVALAGKIMQVRTTDGQTAVTYTAKTAITEQRKASAADAAPGMCAVVRSTGTGASPSPSGQPLTAASVVLSAATGGSCQSGFDGRRAGGAPSGRASDGPGTPPGGAPSGGAGGPSGGAPSGGPVGRRSGGFGATGKIAAVGASSLVVEETRPGSEQTSRVTVTLTADTGWTQEARAGASAVVKGRCVLALGKSDSTGAVTATSLRLSPAVKGACPTGFATGRNPGGTRTGG